MKWFSLPHKNPGLSPRKAQNSWKIGLLFVIISPVAGSFFLLGNFFQWRPQNLAYTSSEVMAFNVSQIAAEITVKIIAQDFLGSGIIFWQQNQDYLVLTNQHVLRSGTSPFKVQTPDGKVYQAQVITVKTSSQDDLAFLSFSSDRQKYQTASIGDRSKLQTEELIFAAGFPGNSETNLAPSSNQLGLVVTEGKVTAILDKPLQEGYQIAYTNNVQKGMSGGPLLNQQGQLVGINGKHAYPLWDAPDFYEDNSQPCPELQELITRSSLAIPVERALVIASQTPFTVQTLENNFLNLSKSHQLLSTISPAKTANAIKKTTEVPHQHCQIK